MHNKRYTLLLLAAILFLSTAFAQPRIKDQGVIGGNDDDREPHIYLTKDGGLIVGGSSNSNISDQKSEKSRGNNGYDYWIVKLDSNRKVQWDKTMGGRDDDQIRALQQTSDGGYIIGGSSRSNTAGEKTQNSRGDYDYWVIKLDSSGTIQWDKTIGGSGFDNLQTIQQTTDGGYIVGGGSRSGLSGEKTETYKGYNDGWIVKLDATGNIQWDKTIGGDDFNSLGSLQQTSDGGYILCGFSNSNISYDKTQNSRGGYDYWLIKMDAAGNIQWDKTIGGNRDDFPTDLQQTTDGGYVLGGNSNSNISGEKTENNRASNYSYDYWVVKVDGSGTVQWDKTIGGGGNDELRGLQQTSDGGYILGGGSTSNNSGDKTEKRRGDYDYWIVKLGTSGNIQWDKTIGGSYYDYVSAIREMKMNNYVIAGSSTSGISGDKTGGNKGGAGSANDYWLIELRYVKPDSTAITQIPTSRFAAPEQKSTTTFSIYPNPATTVLHIQNTGKATFILSDQSGKRLLTKTLEGNGDLNVSVIPAGTYYLTNTITNTTQKVIITK